jgi:succinyl-diaminopimelate desuccinylase
LKERLNIRSDFYFKIGEPFYPSYVVDENLQYLKKLQEIYKEKTNSVLELEYGEGVSDSNCLVELGNIPTINFGPTGGPFHAPNEWVSKNQIFNVIEIYLKLLGEYLF